jgi:hypothetical protein
VDTTERERHLQTLRATPDRLREALRGVPAAVLRWRPAPGKWSILEILGHMRDMERDAYVARYRRILAEDRPDLPDVDGDRYAVERGYREARASEVIRDWRRLRRETLRILRDVRGPAWAREGVHEVAGPLTMDALLVRHAVGNDGAHLAQIVAIKRRHALLERLRTAPARAAAALRGTTDEAARGTEALRAICHLRDFELLTAERLAKIAQQDAPALSVMDDARVAEARSYAEASLRRALAGFRDLRAETLVLLRALPHAAWQRTGRHPRQGPVTIERLAEALADHDAAQIARIS